MRVSDIIANFIYELLNEEGGIIELQRNELANRFKVVPSQINYVITSRFTPEQGYMVESRRGGGGFIRIKRVKAERGEIIMHIINTIGNEIDSITAEIFVKNMLMNDVIDEIQAKLIRAAVSDNVYNGLPPQIRDILRAAILKNMLICIIS